MKIQCSVCDMAEATVLCCADEAALCLTCDEKVHAVNKLANKHQRVSISSSSSHIPKCDVCQETVGYFFCLEDRALLCRKCDVAIHTANKLVSSHQRFLLTGVKLELEATDLGSSSLPEQILEPDNGPVSKTHATLSKTVSQIEDLLSTRTPLTGGSGAGSVQQWQFDEFLVLDDRNQYLNYMDNNGSSKVDDNWKLGETESCVFVRTGEEELRGTDYFSQVPDASWAVPEIRSPSSIDSELYWPKVHHDLTESMVYVPDVSTSPLLNLYNYQPQATRS